MLTSVHSWTSCQVTSVVGEPVPTWEAAWRSDRRPALLLAGHRAARTQQPMWGRKACIPLPDWRAVISTRHLSAGFPGGSVVKNLPAKAGDPGLIPRPGISPGGGNGNPLQDSCLENAMDRGAWWATVHWVTQSQTWLKRLSMHATLCSWFYHCWQ